MQASLTGNGPRQTYLAQWVALDSALLLTTALLGDRLAADYLLLHLISRVYHRRDVLVLGKLSLSLCLEGRGLGLPVRVDRDAALLLLQLLPGLPGYLLHPESGRDSAASIDLMVKYHFYSFLPKVPI